MYIGLYQVNLIQGVLLMFDVESTSASPSLFILSVLGDKHCECVLIPMPSQVILAFNVPGTKLRMAGQMKFCAQRHHRR